MTSADIETLTFESGETLFSPNSEPDTAYVLLTGSVCVAGDSADAPLIVGPGAMIGEIDLLLGQPYSASAIALERVSAVRLTRPQLAAALRATPNPSTADMRSLFAGFAHRIAERLGTQHPPAARPAHEPAFEPVPQQVATEPSPWTAIALTMPGKGNNQVGERLTRHRLPFAIGRKPGRRESAPQRPVDLALDDSKPYNLSRRHFAIDFAGDRPVIRDIGSLLGTSVNGVRIGAGRPSNVAPLETGQNVVVAGASDSPFRFTVTVLPD